MKKLVLSLVLLLFFIENGNAQRKLYRHLFRNEVSVIYRYDKKATGELFGIGYEFSLNKNKTYLSVANEFSSQFSAYSKNVGNELISVLKINLQNQHITSLGVGLKHIFSIKKTNLVFAGGYKYDVFKYKLTLSANVLFEFYKPFTSTLGVGSICTGNCPKYLYFWYFGFSVGKYF